MSLYWEDGLSRTDSFYVSSLSQTLSFPDPGEPELPTKAEEMHHRSLLQQDSSGQNERVDSIAVEELSAIPSASEYASSSGHVREKNSSLLIVGVDEGQSTPIQSSASVNVAGGASIRSITNPRKDDTVRRVPGRETLAAANIGRLPILTPQQLHSTHPCPTQNAFMAPQSPPMTADDATTMLSSGSKSSLIGEMLEEEQRYENPPDGVLEEVEEEEQLSDSEADAPGSPLSFQTKLKMAKLEHEEAGARRIDQQRESHPQQSGKSTQPISGIAAPMIEHPENDVDKQLDQQMYWPKSSKALIAKDFNEKHRNTDNLKSQKEPNSEVGKSEHSKDETFDAHRSDSDSAALECKNVTPPSHTLHKRKISTSITSPTSGSKSEPSKGAALKRQKSSQTVVSPTNHDNDRALAKSRGRPAVGKRELQRLNSGTMMADSLPNVARTRRQQAEEEKSRPNAGDAMKARRSGKGAE